MAAMAGHAGRGRTGAAASDLDAGPAAPSPSRWESLPGGSVRGYGAKFAALVRSDVDIDGEARLADVLSPRGARILDAGCGMGRVGAALAGRGHRVHGVDLDDALLQQAAETYPGLSLTQGRLEQLSPAWMRARDLPEAYDLIVCVGNVFVYLAPQTERAVLGAFAELLAPGGRVLLGFGTSSDRPAARSSYPVADLVRDAASVGLAAQHLWSSFDLQPLEPSSDFVVAVLSSGVS